MPSPSTTLIRVPAELHAKLKELAAHRQTTMVDVLHGFVREAEARGEIAAGPATFRITLDLDQTLPRITLGSGEAELAVLHPLSLEEFCDKLDTVARRGGQNFVALEACQVMIARVGTGIVIERQDPLPDPEAEPIRRVLNAAHAIELAASLRRAVPTNA